ncbi:MAG: M14 family zinc carboxypeptidase [Planctomycetota bacterium]
MKQPFRAAIAALGAASSLVWIPGATIGAEPPAACALAYIDTGFENASPLYWEVDAAGRVHVHLVYDQERSSPNRANGHWHFRVEATKGSDLTLVLHNFDNVWNGKPGLFAKAGTPCLASRDGKRWEHLATSVVKEPSGSALEVRLPMAEDAMYVAGVEPYALRDLDALLREIRPHAAVEISTIGKTVEGRDLEIIRVGNPAAAHRVLLRARAHSWEAGGNWAVQGLIRRLLAPDELAARCRDAYCLYVLPMANKDGVARGRTRFNLRGMDLNRKWDRPADPALAPENHALERWLDERKRAGELPELALDLHNDQDGGLHLSRPEGDLKEYLDRMKRLEDLLRRHTSFTEGSSGPDFRNPGTFGEGLLERYGIHAAILELNANWIAPLKKPPSGADWERFGEGLAKVFLEYFGS